MEILQIRGGRRLEGSLRVQGAKNSVLPILAASLVSGAVSVIENCPALRDVEASAAILRHLGCTLRREGSTLIVDSGPVDRCDVPDALMREMRSSVLFLGAVLARTGCASLSLPGGCELGPRPIDLHLSGLRAMGAEIAQEGSDLRCRTAGLRGCEIQLTIPSVGATENLMLAACRAEGTTVIRNAAREPEIVDLQGFLRAMGASVQGAGSATVVVEGSRPLTDCRHAVLGDRIAAATYLAAAAASGGDVEVRGVSYRHLSTVTGIFSEAGCHVCSEPDSVRLRSRGRLRGVGPVHTAPYPGFPTDAQAPVMAALAGSLGETVFVENIFSDRYRHVRELRRLGADIRTEGRVAVVHGVPYLHGAQVRATDLRGGAGLTVAALAAMGESEIAGLEHIDRGYEEIETVLAALGADIRRRESIRKDPDLYREGGDARG